MTDLKPATLDAAIDLWMRKRVTHRSLRPYATAIGHANLAWNALHDEMAAAFLFLMRHGHGPALLAIWNAIENDRLQRRILRDASKAQFAGTADRAEIADAVSWLVTEADKLSDARNNAVHAPIEAWASVIDPSRHTVEPAILHDNPRAKKLRERQDVLSELTWIRETAIQLQQYCAALKYCFPPNDAPLPDKPRLPNRGQKSRHKGGQRSGSAKQRPRPPRSSRA